MAKPAPSRYAAALDYLERLKSQAAEFGGGVVENLADRARDVGGLAYEGLLHRLYANSPTPRIDQAAQDLGTIGRAIVTQPLKTGKAIVQGEIDRAQEATTSPRAAGEYAGSFIDPMRIAAALRKGGTMRRDIFVGESAKTWNQKEADRALAMEAYGVGPETIWQETGTFRGPDGKWRQEISDEKVTGRFTHIAPSEQRLAETVLAHPELMEAYPDLAKIRQFGLQEPKRRGSYEVTTMNTVDGPRVLGEALVVRGPDEESLASTALHELQHAVQRREGFQRGANPAEFKNKTIPPKLKDAAFSRSMRETAIGNRMRELGYPVGEGKTLNLALPDVLQEVKNFATTDEQLKKLLTEFQDLNEKLKKYPDKYTQYARAAGEVEARATQTRQKMSPEERRTIFPLQSYDTPINELIIRKK